jgi:putative membrane protein
MLRIHNGTGQFNARTSRRHPLSQRDRVLQAPRTRRTLAWAVTCVALSVFSAAALADGVDGASAFLGHVGRAEIASCELALRTSSDPSVQAFATRMIADHKSLDARIESLARRKGYKLPDGITITQHATETALKPLTGHTFDKVFMKHNVSDHKDDIKNFSQQAQQGSDADVRALAADALPTLREHLKLAEQAQTKVSGQ